MSERPTPQELAEAIEEFLSGEILPTLDDHRLRFRLLVALNALGIVGRELAKLPPEDDAEQRRLAARIRAGDVAGPDPRRELPLHGVVLRRQLPQLAPHDAERVERHERPEAEPVIVEGGEDLAGEELLDRLRELVRGGALAHVTPSFSSRWQISYSTSAPSRPRMASSTLRSCPDRWRCACVRQPIAQPTLPASSQ